MGLRVVSETRVRSSAFESESSNESSNERNMYKPPGYERNAKLCIFLVWTNPGVKKRAAYRSMLMQARKD